MALKEMEFLGNNRYFKYRFANETEITYATIDEKWNVKSKATEFEMIADYLKQSLNMKVKWEKVAIAANMRESHIFTFDMARSYFDKRIKYFTPSSPYGMSETIILSGAPKRVLSTSWSFLNMDTPVVILIVFTLVILSLLLVLHSVVTNKYKSVPSKKVVKKMARETMENVWENASLLCLEPIPSILPHITCRLLASSWLIGVTFTLFYLGCFLRTEFTTESYNYIDTLSDLIKSGIPTGMIKETYKRLQFLAAQDPSVKEWLGELDQNKCLTDFLDISGKFFIPIVSGQKAAIMKVEHFNSFFELIMRYKKDMIYAMKEGLYFSQEDVAFDYLHTMFNTSWVRSSPQLHESLQLSMAPIFETKVFKYLDFEFDYTIKQLKWEKPPESVTDLDLKSVCVPFYFLLMLLSGPVAVVITEIIFYYLT